MRVLFNGLTALKPRTGIGQYCVKLAEVAATMLPPGEFDVYPTPFVRRVVSKSLKYAGGKSNSGSALPTWKQKVRRQITRTMKNLGQTATGIHFQRHARTTGASLYHEPNYLPFVTDLPTVVTVHDLSVLLHPEWHPADRVRQHEHKLRRAVVQAEHVITDTEQVKTEILRELGMKAEKVTAIHLGVGPEFQPVSNSTLHHWQRHLDLPALYFLCVGTIEPRKNLLTAMRAFAALPDAVRQNCPLLLAGPWGWRADAERRFYDTVGRAAGIRHLGYVPDEAMPAMYTGAVALLYPSLYEGFGLPPLEANACGTPAICSLECDAVREVMSDAAQFVNAADIDGLRKAMTAILESQISITPMSNRFTWNETASKTIAVYRQVLNVTSTLRAAA